VIACFGRWKQGRRRWHAPSTLDWIIYGLGHLDGLERKAAKLLVLARERRALLQTIVPIK
jgi:hypothetical protein